MRRSVLISWMWIRCNAVVSFLTSCHVFSQCFVLKLQWIETAHECLFEHWPTVSSRHYRCELSMLKGLVHIVIIFCHHFLTRYKHERLISVKHKRRIVEYLSWKRVSRTSFKVSVLFHGRTVRTWQIIIYGWIIVWLFRLNFHIMLTLHHQRLSESEVEILLYCVECDLSFY